MSMNYARHGGLKLCKVNAECSSVISQSHCLLFKKNGMGIVKHSCVHSRLFEMARVLGERSHL